MRDRISTAGRESGWNLPSTTKIKPCKPKLKKVTDDEKISWRATKAYSYSQSRGGSLKQSPLLWGLKVKKNMKKEEST